MRSSRSNSIDNDNIREIFQFFYPKHIINRRNISWFTYITASMFLQICDECLIKCGFHSIRLHVLFHGSFVQRTWLLRQQNSIEFDWNCVNWNGLPRQRIVPDLLFFRWEHASEIMCCAHYRPIDIRALNINVIWTIKTSLSNQTVISFS